MSRQEFDLCSDEIVVAGIAALVVVADDLCAVVLAVDPVVNAIVAAEAADVAGDDFHMEGLETDEYTERRYLILAPLLDAGNWCYVGLGPTEISLTQDSRPALSH